MRNTDNGSYHTGLCSMSDAMPAPKREGFHSTSVLRDARPIFILQVRREAWEGLSTFPAIGKEGQICNPSFQAKIQLSIQWRVMNLAEQVAWLTVWPWCKQCQMSPRTTEVACHVGHLGTVWILSVPADSLWRNAENREGLFSSWMRKAVWGRQFLCRILKV